MFEHLHHLLNQQNQNKMKKLQILIDENFKRTLLLNIAGKNIRSREKTDWPSSHYNCLSLAHHLFKK